MIKKVGKTPKASAWTTFWENLAHRKRTDRSFYATLLALQFFIGLIVVGVILFFVWRSTQLRSNGSSPAIHLLDQNS